MLEFSNTVWNDLNISLNLEALAVNKLYIKNRMKIMKSFRGGACFQTEAFNYYLASVWPHPTLPPLSLVLCRQCVNSHSHTSLKQYWRCRFTVFFIFSWPWSHIYKLEWNALWIMHCCEYSELFCRGVFNLALDLESLQRQSLLP